MSSNPSHDCDGSEGAHFIADLLSGFVELIDFAVMIIEYSLFGLKDVLIIRD